MKLNAGMFLVMLAAGSAQAQITAVPPHVQDQLNTVQQQKKSASDAALQGNAKTPAGKPSAATTKPAAANATTPATTTAAKATTASKAASTTASAKPAAVPALKISNTQAQAPKAPAAKASSAASVSAKPATALAAKAAVAQTAPVKTAPASNATAKNTSASNAAKPVAVTSKTAAADWQKVSFASGAKPAVANGKADTKSASASKQKDPFAKPANGKATAPAVAAAKKSDAKPGAPAPAATEAKAEPAKDDSAKEETKKEAGFITAGNRRDPFISPIVEHVGGSGCSTGKRCLAIDQIALRGIVKSDSGMIAVVVNSLDKAYFLRENDPVFNGYVLKISGDSVVFKETVQDKLGHLSTREVVKKITTPAV